MSLWGAACESESEREMEREREGHGSSCRVACGGQTLLLNRGLEVFEKCRASHLPAAPIRVLNLQHPAIEIDGNKVLLLLLLAVAHGGRAELVLVVLLLGVERAEGVLLALVVMINRLLLLDLELTYGGTG